MDFPQPAADIAISVNRRILIYNASHIDGAAHADAMLPANPRGPR